MKQLLKKTPVQTILGLSFLFLFIGAMATAPQIVNKITNVLLILVGIIGAVKVWNKWKSGASDVQPTAMTWFGSYLTLLMLSTILFSVFGK